MIIFRIFPKKMKQRYFVFISFILILISCRDTRKDSLQNSPSLYIRAHADDLVEWHVWSDDVFRQAKKAQKLVLISIGYSSCHWCHVMQRESFQNREIASLMNANYYCVKIDREEYPDIDAYYAHKQEELTGWAGWPMHVILNPEKEIIWTGIYLKPKKWKSLIVRISDEYKRNNNFRMMTENEIVSTKNKYLKFSFDTINRQIFLKSDTLNGGLMPTHYRRKYPNVNLLMYLLNVYDKGRDENLGAYLKLTANRMACGGINDQIEGGFFRFSVDEIWHLPHFEKMLYTNAQMIAFYVEAYKILGDKLYSETAERTADFLIGNLKSETGLYFSALDADQETEGGYYTYSKSELQSALNSDFEIAAKYYHLTDSYKLKDGKFHLHANETDSVFVQNQNSDMQTWAESKYRIRRILRKLRRLKQHPKRDNKLITSWNALLADAFLSLSEISGNDLYRAEYKCIAAYLLSGFRTNKKLNHYYLTTGKNKSECYPEDLLYTAKLFCDIYESDSLQIDYLNAAFEIYGQYSRKKTDFYIFPTDDRILPSVLSHELFLRQYFKNKPLPDYKFEQIDSSKIAEYPERYGAVLLQLSNKTEF